MIEHKFIFSAIQHHSYVIGGRFGLFFSTKYFHPDECLLLCNVINCWIQIIFIGQIHSSKHDFDYKMSRHVFVILTKVVFEVFPWPTWVLCHPNGPNTSHLGTNFNICVNLHGLRSRKIVTFNNIIKGEENLTRHWFFLSD